MRTMHRWLTHSTAPTANGNERLQVFGVAQCRLIRRHLRLPRCHDRVGAFVRCRERCFRERSEAASLLAGRCAHDARPRAEELSTSDIWWQSFKATVSPTASDGLAAVQLAAGGGGDFGIGATWRVSSAACSPWRSWRRFLLTADLRHRSEPTGGGMSGVVRSERTPKQSRRQCRRLSKWCTLLPYSRASEGLIVQRSTCLSGI